MRPDQAASGWTTALSAGLIALAALAVYANGFSGAFILDDVERIEQNPTIRHLWPPRPWLLPSPVNPRPLVGATLAVNYALGRFDVWGYHAVNLAIHILAAWTLFGIVRRTLSLPRMRERFGTAATPLALAAALVWTVHPLQTAAVTYVIQRSESLVGLFYLLTLYCTLRGTTVDAVISKSAAIRWYVGSAIACLLGMATKEVMATAPLVVLLYDRTFLSGTFRAALRQRWGLYLALCASWGVLVWLLIGSGFHHGSTGFTVREFTWQSYLLTQPGVLVHYLRLAIWPAGLCLDYGWPPAHGLAGIAVPGLLILALLGLTCWAVVKRPAMGFLGAWFFLILAPTSSFVPIKDAAFEHRMYLPLAALAVLAVIAGWRLHAALQSQLQWRAGAALLALVLLALGWGTVRRNDDYHSQIGILRKTVLQATNNARTRINLASYLIANESYAEAAENAGRGNCTRAGQRDGAATNWPSPSMGCAARTKRSPNTGPPSNSIPTTPRPISISDRA